MLKPVFTKHFAERFLDRCGDFDTLSKIKKRIRDNFCQIVFDCILNERINSHKLKIDGFNIVMSFNPHSKVLSVRTIYKA